MKYLDNQTIADNPGNIKISNSKFRKIRKMFNLNFFEKRLFNMQKPKINEYMNFGDTQPAVVYSTNPLMIAAYSDEMDAVIMLEFPTELASEYNLQCGTKLVTSNVYKYKNSTGIAPDIYIGENYLDRYIDFTPIVSLFLSDNEEYLRDRVNLFNVETWKMVEDKMNEYIEKHPNQKRNGFFYLLP